MHAYSTVVYCARRLTDLILLHVEQVSFLPIHHARSSQIIHSSFRTATR